MKSESANAMTLWERGNFPKQDCIRYQNIIEQALEEVTSSGQIILAEGVRNFEAEFANWLADDLTPEHCIGVGNGTDALELAMRCAGVEEGSGVIVPSLTAYATVAAILRIGAQPIFADVEPDRPVISSADVERLLEKDRRVNSIRAVIAVHLYGEACELRTLNQLCNHYETALIEDCAQATGTTYEGMAVGTFGDFSAFSFYPTKNLAALGDGGMLVIGKGKALEMLEAAKRLRFYGWDEKKEAVQYGVNSRLDEIQAWILRGKLKELDRQIEKRRSIALKYKDLLSNMASEGRLTMFKEYTNVRHSYHLYVIMVDPARRDEIITSGKDQGIPYGVHYSQACHQHQYIIDNFNLHGSHLPNSERYASSVLSLPMNPYLLDTDIELVSHHLHSVFSNK